MAIALKLKKTFVAVMAGALAAMPGLALADPPGNNGTVKIDRLEFDTHPNNQPHVGCIFQVDFYGYDEGDLDADYTFKLVPPTAGGSTGGSVFIGQDAAGGGTDLDAEVTVDLTSLINSSGVDPHPIQGYHVKLTVNAEGSQGADVKHKVFWVEGCGEPNGSADLPPQEETQTLDGDTTSYLAPEETKLDGPLALVLLGGMAGAFLVTRKLAGRLLGEKSNA